MKNEISEVCQIIEDKISKKIEAHQNTINQVINSTKRIYNKSLCEKVIFTKNNSSNFDLNNQQLAKALINFKNNGLIKSIK